MRQRSSLNPIHKVGTLQWLPDIRLQTFLHAETIFFLIFRSAFPQGTGEGLN